MRRLFAWLRRVFATHDAGFLTRDGRELRWTERPLGVYLTREAEAYRAPIERVLGEYNRAVGRRMFFSAFAASPELVTAFEPGILLQPRGAVLVGVGHAAEPDHGHTVLQSVRGEIRSCVVTLPPGMDAAMAHAVALHEIGHVLGLAHDEDPSSIMYPRTRGRGQALSAADAERLRSAYG